MASRNIKDCLKSLQTAWPKLRALFQEEFPGWTMALTCTYRTPEEQFELFKKGRKLADGKWVLEDAAKRVTNVDGKTKLSNHNRFPARAFDVALKSPKGALVWDSKLAPWQALP